MKYILLPSLMSLAGAAHAIVPHTHGIYAGLGSVYARPTNHLSIITTKLSYSNSKSDVNTTRTSEKSTFTGRVLGGYYAKYPGNIFLQAELFGQGADPQQTIQPLNTINTHEKLGITSTRQWTTGASMKAGYYFNDAVGAFVSAGAVYSHFKTAVTSLLGGDYARTSSQNQRVWGGTLGSGLIYSMQGSFLLKAEYMYERYKKFATHPLQSYYNQPFTNITNKITSKIRYHTFAVTVAYLF